MTSQIIIAVIAALTSSGFMSLVIYLLQRHDKKKEHEEANESAQSKMLLGLGHDKLMSLTDSGKSSDSHKGGENSKCFMKAHTTASLILETP